MTAAFGFDPEDRLTSAPAPVSTGTTYYVYDGGHPLLEETFSGTAATLLAVNVSCADGVRARFLPSSGLFYAFDFDGAGDVVGKQNSGDVSYVGYSTASFEAYGRRGADYQMSTGANPATHQDPFRFGGQYGYYTDAETGLLCLTHRYYDPGTGKFLTRDPIGYGGRCPKCRACTL